MKLLNNKKPLSIIYFALVLFGALSFNACKKSSDTVTPVTPAVTVDSTAIKTSVNNWSYALMNEAYFWSKNMPKLSTLNLTDVFDTFFEKLIYNRSTVDRYSMITDDYAGLQNEFNGVSKIFGLQYAFAPLDSSKVNYGMFLSQVVSGSAAEAAGLKRGDVIIKIDNINLNPSNLASFFSNGDTHVFGLGKLVNNIWTLNSSVSITRVVTNENPVGLSKVITLPVSGKKLGYLLYNQFVPGIFSTKTHADSIKYDEQLKTIFGNFKSQAVSELVLDLRFNGGGYVSSSEVLASLIGTNITNKVFYKDQYNDLYQAYFTQKYGADFSNNYFLTQPNNIGNQISRVFVLTSNGTASASELVINGLKPYMSVILVGEHTNGKNLFGTLQQNASPYSNYGIYLMLGQTANALGQSDYGTVNGMTPDYIVKDNIIPYYPFGDFSETLFKQVLKVLGENTGVALKTTAGVTIKKDSYMFKENLTSPVPLAIKDMKKILK